MSSNLDIYAITNNRNLETINKFLTCYIDYKSSYVRDDKWLMLRKLDAPDNSERREDYEWEPVTSLTQIVQRGLDYPRRSFSAYLASSHPEFERIILSFTTDDKLILGLSLEDSEEEKPEERLEQAKVEMFHLIEECNCYGGLILVETPPPDNELMFYKEAEAPYCSYFWAKNDVKSSL
jgi:hypothetical protein